MRKTVYIVMLIALGLAISAVSFAQEPAETEKPMMGEQAKAGMKHKGFGMMKRMTGKEIVATEDGGVVVMMGRKLLKYDKDLNLIKEVEIKIDPECMKEMMKQHREEMQGETAEE